MKIGADFLLHRWDREQDENGDVTLKSMVSRFFSLSTESTMGNFLWGSELYSLIDNAIQGKDYDVISATNISAVNDMASDVVKFTAELKKDTSEMDEAELEKHHKKLMEKGMALIENGFEIVGVPYGNGRKMGTQCAGTGTMRRTWRRAGSSVLTACRRAPPGSTTGCTTPMPAATRTRHRRRWRNWWPWARRMKSTSS